MLPPTKVRDEFRLIVPHGERELIVLVMARLMLRPDRRRTMPMLLDQRPIAAPKRRKWWLALATLPIAGFGWLAWQSTAPEAARPGAVEVAIPGDIEVDLPELAPRDVTPVSAPAPVNVVINLPKPRPAARTEQDAKTTTALLSIDKLPEVETAVRASFGTGAATSWSAKGMHGYAVAGPIQVEEGRVCRNIAIWTKGAGGRGSTTSVRKCMAAGGAWISVGGPVTADPDG